MKWPWYAVIAVSMVGTTAACGTDDGRSATVIEATVRVRADGCGPRTELGVGTSIGDGLVVTAAHVVAGADRVEIVDHLDTTIAAEVVFFDPALDVAALRPATPVEATAPLRAVPAAGGDVGLIAVTSVDGAIELVDVEVVQRVSIDTTDIYRDEQVQRPGLRLRVAVEPGDSGAMMHLRDGGVGIVWSRSTEGLDQAWTVDLPADLVGGDARRALSGAVDTGPCA